MQERLQKFLANAGVASRRHAEELITSGLVKINGKTVTQLGTKVDPGKDEVMVRGQKIKPMTQLIYLAFNKPKRYMTTRYDPEKRKTVYDLLPPELRSKVWPVGRLDFHTEGLLLFTNDGELTQKLTHPSAEHEKEYEVILDKELTDGKIEKIKTGVKFDGKITAPAKISVAGKTVHLTIHEGWKRQIRRMFAALGYTVRNLKRVRVGKLKLGDLPLGQYRNIEKNQVL